jgi:hypothetical protein
VKKGSEYGARKRVTGLLGSRERIAASLARAGDPRWWRDSLYMVEDASYAMKSESRVGARSDRERTKWMPGRKAHSCS